MPWLLVKPWILPLPDTIQEQPDEAIGHGFDGMIVYIDQAGKPPQYYAAGWHNRKSRMPAKLDERFAFGVFDNEALYQRLRAKKQDEIDQIRGQLQESELKISNLDS